MKRWGGSIKNIHSILFIRNKSNSLFLRLVVGFLCIVLLLASLTFYAISVSQKNIKQEIVKYNTMMLNNTRDSYEKHLDLIKRQMYLFFINKEIQNLKDSPKYEKLPDIVEEIRTWTTNPYLFINNIVLYSKREELVLEKGTSTNASMMFNVFYTSSEYPLDFWRQQFNEPYMSRILPSSNFLNNMYRTSPQLLGELIPIIIKNKENQDLYMIVFIDAIKMSKAFHQSIYNDFIIYDEDGKTIFKVAEQGPFIAFEDLQKYGSSEFIKDKKYYFLIKGEGTGLTYVYRVPVEQIVSQTRLNITLIVIIVTAITLSILFSFLFAARINNPLKKVIESIRHMNDEVPYRSNIKEFDIISGEIHDHTMIRKQMSFINHLKEIRNHDHDTMKLDFTNKPFVFVLFQIQHYKSDLNTQALVQKWLYYIKIFIDSKLRPTFPDSLTFQIERDQVLSLVFTKQLPDLMELLSQMKEVFDHDKEYGVVTIAITSVYLTSDQLSAAYEEVQELLGERLLIDGTQIIHKRAATQVAVGFSPDQEKEFEVHLKAGNTQQLVALLEHLFVRWQSKGLSAAVMMRFAESLIGKIQNATTPFPLDPDGLDVILEKAVERIQRCCTIGELELLLIEWVTKTAEAVQEKKEEKYPVTSFVIDYINEHLAEDIYLDLLAEKVKMSSGYLSSYFKGKTGKNIVDYINETRITKATSLLADNQTKILEAAQAVGYQNITSFNRMFKKYTGLTPSEYRKKYDSVSEKKVP
ncbi:AraC-like DNA-binding protein [Paenibacillus baekrokdamisoli]|nr:AraC-like DNA-binding protein [Paenibacillus baekrokdamisoli]